MRSFMLGLGLALLLPTLTAAQQIRGVVVEDSTFRPISDAKIEMFTADTTILATSASAANGWFNLLPRSAGQFLVRASHPAYTVTSTLAVTVDPQESITVILRLSGGPIPLDPVVARATARGRLSGFDERARRAAFGKYITRADIDKRGGYSLAHILRFTPEVRVERVFDGAFTSNGVFMRSFGDLCTPSIFLDGMRVPTEQIFDIDDLLSLEAVEGIEVYRSALSAPMEFRMPGFESDGTCGVIVVWSRPLQRAPVTLKRVLIASLLASSSVLLARLFQ